MSFSHDHILRLENGQPVGRVVLRSEKDYVPGEDFSAALVKFPKCFNLEYRELSVWVDGNEYKLPENPYVQKRVEDDVLANVAFKRIKNDDN